uniref:Origin recognition complex subunit 1 n=1 Tax=Anopheles atroparvus TaxID=41427 RepID=A0A182JH06_ANOAO
MKTKSFNNNTASCPITWVGKQYYPDISGFKHRTAVFYSKCIFGAMTLEVGSYVLVSNIDSADPESVDGCDVARIEHLYEVFNVECTKMDPCRAIVQWYSRPDGLPKSITADENFSFDAREVVEDSRFNPDISIETIYGPCRLEKLSVQENLAEVLSNSTARCPVFFARYKLTKSSARRWHLESIFPTFDITTPRKRRTMVDKSNQSPVVVVRTPRTPKLKLTRTKSMETLGSINEDLKQKIIEDRWAVKLIDVKSNLDYITNALSEVEISEDEQNVSPKKHPKLERSSRSSMNFKRNLDSSFHVADDGNEEDCLNYSIVQESSNNTPNMKIKLRVSESNKKPGTPRSSVRKRVTSETTGNEPVSPPKCRKSLLPAEPETAGTPAAGTRRKSILKTPSNKTTEIVACTPKRNIQLSNIVEECGNGRRVSRVLDLTPKKTQLVDEEPKTPRGRGRPSSVAIESEELEEELKTPKRRGRPPSTGGTDLASSTGKATPKSANKMKLIRSGVIKPNIHSRDAPVQGGANELAVARERLHVSSIPSSLPCRGKEYEEIYNFLESKIYDGCGGCMYVSGVPGTGKTATTTAVIRALKHLSDEEEIPKFDFIDINGMRLTEPRQAYVHIYRQLTGKTVAWEQAYNMLNKRFTTKAPRRVTTVLLVDELDILCNRRQDVVYNLLNWPTLSTAQLIVVTIANTMDLPERLLMGKIASRLGLTRLTFQPYNFRQLQEIVMARLEGTSAFNSDAVQLVARKVAAVSGDARRALDICRRSTELADYQSKKSNQPATVSMLHVQQALGEMIASAKVKTILCCSRLEQLFLQAVTAEVIRTGIEECNFLGVYAQFESLAAFSGISVPNPGRAMAICARLGASRLLVYENGRNDIYQKILLNISTDDVHYALQASKLL